MRKVDREPGVQYQGISGWRGRQDSECIRHSNGPVIPKDSGVIVPNNGARTPGEEFGWQEAQPVGRSRKALCERQVAQPAAASSIRVRRRNQN